MPIRKIVSRSIGTDVIAAEDLAANSVTVSEIQDGAVSSAKLDTNIDIAGTLDVTGDLTADSGVKLPTASGGVYTITGTDTATNRTLVLPDSAGTIATTNGITNYDQWYLTSELTNPGAGEVTVTANLQRVSGNITGAGYIGTAMSVSSGVFTFPTTGMWLIRLEAHGTSTGDTSGHINTAITTDNSTYTNILKVDLGVANSGDPVRSVSGGEVLVDITDTATHKIKFVTDSMTATSLFGESAKIRTNFTFIRLGDT